jgi:hypothetical protein
VQGSGSIKSPELKNNTKPKKPNKNPTPKPNKTPKAYLKK